MAMSFTGPKAAKFKIAYIAAFNQMESNLGRPGTRIFHLRFVKGARALVWGNSVWIALPPPDSTS